MSLKPCRECGNEVSSEAPTCPRCGVQDPVPSLPAGTAPHGGPWDDWVRYRLRKDSAEEVAAKLEEHGVDPEVALKEVRRLQDAIRGQSAQSNRSSRSDRRGGATAIESLDPKVLGLVGSVLLLIGAFLPLLSLPLVGDINYVHDGRGDGIIIVLLAVISGVLTLKERCEVLALTSGVAGAVILFTFVNLQYKLSDSRREMMQGLADNPLRGVGEAMLGSVHLEWGWAVLVLGVLALATSAYVDAR